MKESPENEGGWEYDCLVCVTLAKNVISDSDVTNSMLYFAKKTLLWMTEHREA